jgi:hypothetical protein
MINFFRWFLKQLGHKRLPPSKLFDVRKGCYHLFRFFSTLNCRLPTALVLSAMVLTSCEQGRNPCLQPTTVYVRAHTYQHLADSSTTDTLLPNPRWIAIDSGIALTYGKKVSRFTFPLNPLADSARYALQPDSAVGRFDTMVFYYRKRLQFLSNSCGYTYFYSLENIKSTLHLIDSVKLQNGDVNNDVNTAEHVQIYF